MLNVKVVENGVQAKEVIEDFVRQGFTHDDIYLFAHDKDRSTDLTDALDANNVGMAEQGFFDKLSNVFRSRGDELRSKMQSVGLSEPEAEKYEVELDRGRVLIVATKAA
ncbi:general stress protein [Bacillus songklensis]|uniref:General stress protein n=1 Tax=Bacillus songklensis TaxID=1069116 RepID=A0ABV8B8V9_9BACI